MGMAVCRVYRGIVVIGFKILITWTRVWQWRLPWYTFRRNRWLDLMISKIKRKRDREELWNLPGFVRNWVDGGTKGKEVGRKFLEENKNCILDLFVWNDPEVSMTQWKTKIYKLEGEKEG